MAEGTGPTVSLLPTQPSVARLADGVSSPRLRKLLQEEDGPRRVAYRQPSLSAREARPLASQTRPTPEKRLVDGVISPRLQKLLLDEDASRLPRSPAPRTAKAPSTTSIKVSSPTSPAPLPILDSSPTAVVSGGGGGGASPNSGGGGGGGSGSRDPLKLPVIAADAHKRAANRQLIEERKQLAAMLTQEARDKERQRKERRRQQQLDKRRRREAQEQEHAAVRLQARIRGGRARTKVAEKERADPGDMMRRRAKAMLDKNFSVLDSYFEYAEKKLRRAEREARGDGASMSSMFLTAIDPSDSESSPPAMAGSRMAGSRARAVPFGGRQQHDDFSAGFFGDLSSTAQPAFVEAAIEKLKEAMHSSLSRITDIFRSMDRNYDGRVSRREFVSVLPLVFGADWAKSNDIPFDTPTMGALFDALDVDGSGDIEYNELNAALRRTDGVALDGKLLAGAMGKIDTESKNKIALRSSAAARREAAVRNREKPLRTSASVDELTAALVRGCTRVSALFRALDRDGDGQLSKEEFRAVLPLLGFDSKQCRSVADEVFDSIDLDGNGFLKLEELDVALGQKLPRNLPLPSRRYAYPWEVRRRDEMAIVIQKWYRKKRTMNLFLPLIEAMKKKKAEIRRTLAARRIQRHWRRRKARRKWMELLAWAEKEAVVQAKIKEEEKRQRKLCELTSIKDLKTALVQNASNIITFFRTMDRDGNGTITKAELEAALPLVGLNGDNKVALDAVFDSMDENHDGELEYEEFARSLKRREAAMAVQASFKGRLVRKNFSQKGLKAAKSKKTQSKGKAKL